MAEVGVQRIQAAFYLVRDLPGRDHMDPTGCQFYGQGHTLHQLADVHHCFEILVQGKNRPHLPGAPVKKHHGTMIRCPGVVGALWV